MEGVREREYFLNNSAIEHIELLWGKMEIRALAPTQALAKVVYFDLFSILDLSNILSERSILLL